MPQALYILFGAAWTWLTALALGKLLLSKLGVPLYREEETPLAYIAGSACLSFIVFVLTASQVFFKGTVLAVGVLAMVAAWKCGAWRPSKERLPALRRWLAWSGGALAAPFFLLYFVNAMAPEMSPDGSSYHLGLVARYYRDHGFQRITTNMYANLSQGIEMLFLYAYAFGRHSAAALEHFSFLVALGWMVVNYGRRIGQPAVGIAGALLVFLSPVVGLDAASAYNDVAIAAILFAVFYLMQVWDSSRANALLIPIGLISGFAYASKYTAFLAVPYALGMIAWRLRKNLRWMRRAVLTVSVCACLMIFPWVVKNVVWLGNPVSPFFNKWFPNPHVHVSFEEGYRRDMRNYAGLSSNWEIPLELTVRGQVLCGLFGPFFLLTPVALLALRRSEGRRLLAAAAIFALPYATNIGTRFLIPALPFLALAISLALACCPRILGLLVLAHGISAWPDVLKQYCSEYAWRLDRIWWKQALRIESEHGFLDRKWPSYSTARMIEQLTPPGSRILASGQTGEAYTSRDILVGFQSGHGERLNWILFTPLLADTQPVRWLSFRFERQAVRRVRVRQTANAAPDNWSVAELRIYDGVKELTRENRWRLRGQPNPWGVQDAFDNSPVTRWNSWETASPGMFLEVDFGGMEFSDRVSLEMSRDQGNVRVELDGQRSDGAWVRLGGDPVESETAPPIGMRREAAEVLKSNGVGYLLLHEGDFSAVDLAQRADDWGVQLLGERWGFRLYKIQ
jgi:hypothetical protein